MIKDASDTLRAAWGFLNQSAAAIKVDKSLSDDDLQGFLSQINDLQDGVAELAAAIRKTSRK